MLCTQEYKTHYYCGGCESFVALPYATKRRLAMETADQLDTVDIERSFVSNALSKFVVDLIGS